MVEQDRAARLKLVLVHKGEDGHVVLGAHRGRHNSMVIVNDLLERAHTHGTTSQVIHLTTLFLWPQQIGLHQSEQG